MNTLFKIQVFIYGLLCLVALSGCERKALIGWECSETSQSSMQCVFKNTGNATGEACFNIVKVCSKAEHSAYVCSGDIPPGGMENKVVTAFTPDFGLFENCMGTEFRNKKIKVQ